MIYPGVRVTVSCHKVYIVHKNMGFTRFTRGGGSARIPDVPMGGAGGVLRAASYRSLCDGNKKIPRRPT